MLWPANRCLVKLGQRRRGGRQASAVWMSTIVGLSWHPGRQFPQVSDQFDATDSVHGSLRYRHERESGGRNVPEDIVNELKLACSTLLWPFAYTKFTPVGYRSPEFRTTEPTGRTQCGQPSVDYPGQSVELF